MCISVTFPLFRYIKKHYIGNVSEEEKEEYIKRLKHNQYELNKHDTVWLQR